MKLKLADVLVICVTGSG